MCLLDEGRGVSPPKHRARPMSEAGGAEYYVRARARAARAPRLQPRDTGAPVHALLMGAGGLCVYCELCVWHAVRVPLSAVFYTVLVKFYIGFLVPALVPVMLMGE